MIEYSIFEFLNFLYPKGTYNGKFVVFNKDTKTSRFYDVNKSKEIEDYIINESNKGNTIQINLALQDEFKAKMNKVKEEETMISVFEYLYKKHINSNYVINKDEQNKIKDILFKLEKKEKALGISLEKKKSEYRHKLLDIENIKSKLNKISNNDIEGYFKDDIQNQINYIMNTVRGKIDTATEIYGLWIDVDVNVLGHHSDGLLKFNSFEEANEFLHSMEIKPSIIINSGGGLHVYYKFSEVLKLNTIEDKNEINMIYKFFGEYLNNKAKKVGGAIDVGNVLQMMRLPNTYNYKNREKPKKVKVEYLNENNILFYEEIKSKFNEELIKKREENNKVLENRTYDKESNFNGKLIYEKCNWVQYKVDNQNECSYSDWNFLIMLCSNLIDGYELAHEWSRDYYKYKPSDVSKKYDYFVDNEFKPFLCKSVESSLCDGCPFKDLIKSPIVLGTDKYKKE